MKALQVERPGVLRYIDAPLPEPGEDEALIRVAYAGICATDLGIYGGDMSLVREKLIRYPVRIGHEWSGAVVRVGRDVRGFGPGDAVVSDPGVSCGHCAHCRAGRYDACADIRSLGTIRCWDGAFAEYMRVPARHLYHLPQSVGLVQGALIEPAGIALAGLEKLPNLRGGVVLISGTGAIGLAAAAFAKALGARRVLLSGRTDEKLSVGLGMGADVAVNVRREALGEIVLRESGGAGADGVMETSGNVEAIAGCLEAARAKATVCLAGFYEREMPHFAPDALVTRALTVRGVMGEFGMAGKVIELMRARGVDLRPMVTRVVPFERAAEAIASAADDAGTRIRTLARVFGEDAYLAGRPAPEGGAPA